MTDRLGVSLDPERVYAKSDGLTACRALHLRRPAPHRVDVGYVPARAVRGRRLVPEALRAALAGALAEPGVFRIGAGYDVGNRASAGVMEKAELIREGPFRRWLVHPNLSAEPRDCFIDGLTRRRVA